MLVQYPVQAGSGNQWYQPHRPQAKERLQNGQNNWILSLGVPVQVKLNWA